MKVLLANKFFFRNGGSEIVMFQERSYLKDAGVEVVDFSMADPRNIDSPYSRYFVKGQSYHESAEQGGLSRAIAGLKLIHSPEAVARFDALIRDTQPDLVHCHNIYHQLTPSIIGVAKRHGVRVVLTLHDYKVVCPVYLRLRQGSVCSDCIDRGVTSVLMNRCADGSLTRSALLYAEAVVQRLLSSYEKVDAFIAPSEFMRASVTKTRLASDRVFVVPNGIEISTQHEDQGDGGYILFLGRLSREKGVETLLRAHEGLSPNIRLVVAGTGPLEQGLRARFNKAEFVGHLRGAELQDTLSQSSLVVVPSEWYENCPMTILEAMASGKAVVASDIGGIPELVTNGTTGLLFPPGDVRTLQSQLTLLMGDPEMRARYGATARQRVLHEFSLQRHNQRLMAVYTAVMEGALRT